MPIPSTAPRTPHALRGLVGLVLAAALTALVAVAPAVASADDAAAFAQRIAQERANAGLPGLRVAGDLADVAARHAQRMASEGRLYHNPSMTSEVSGWQRLTENVGTGPAVGEVHDAFMASSSHRANILDDRVTEVGVGVARADGRLWVSQVFRLPDGTTTAPPADPAPGPDPEPVPAPAPDPEPEAPAPPPADPAPPVVSTPAPAVPATPAAAAPTGPTRTSSIQWDLPEVAPAPPTAVDVGPASSGTIAPAGVPPSVHAMQVARWLVVVGAILDQ